MINDSMVVFGFVVVLIVLCKMWNLYAMKQYKKAEQDRLRLHYGFYVGNMEGLAIVGVESDENGDYGVDQAIKKVELPDHVRIKINE